MEREEVVSVEDQGTNQPPGITLRPFHLSDFDDFLGSSTLLTTKTDSCLIYGVGPSASKTRPIGAISVSQESAENSRHRASIGYVLAPGHWGRGIAARAVKMVVSAVFDEVPLLQRLEAVADVENPASQRVLEKAGFVREAVLRKYFVLKGRARDVVMHSFLSSDSKRLD
ncbi:hypothetical protein H6P81_004870 [Aristolochia fimbriata]|uniref:N-acetyltransferase domain-containing protein n=1 Tax=Aristolochia fimbriata TaxID=158543 RepID=A0AAV7EWE8_ARIFI|nr:hypothetical protein H6P81_004870 [Aristolochia fimbriata]